MARVLLALTVSMTGAAAFLSPPTCGAAPLRGGGGVCMSACPTIDLNDGTKHPVIGFGTYKVGFIPASASAAAGGQQQAGGTETTARECVRQALEVGYRFLDCAQFYGNEKEVGLAIQDSGLAREDLYLASKVWTDKIYQGREAVRAQALFTVSALTCRC